MFASAAALILAVSAQQIVIPLGSPKQIDRPRAPIEQSGPRWAQTCNDWDEWDKPAPPVRIHASSYLVGTCGIAAIFIAGSDGHVLIDGGTEAGADVIAANVRALGYRPEDIRYLLHSHEHFDHVGGIARLQQLSGAQLIASAAAAKVFETGTPGSGDPQAGTHAPFPAARVDRIVTDGEEVRIGNLMLTAMATPGHTPGALSWRWVGCDGGNCRTMVYADSLSAVARDGFRFTDHPALLADFRSSFAKIAASPCDILLTPHPSASDMRIRMMAGKPLIDPLGCRAYAAKQGTALNERLAKEATP